MNLLLRPSYYALFMLQLFTFLYLAIFLFTYYVLTYLPFTY